MKLVIVTLLLAASVAVATGQQTTQPVHAAKAQDEAKVIARYVTKIDSPFSAEEINESVQTLVDGNRIVRKSTGKIYRNGAGRVRRESLGGTGDMLGTSYWYGQGVSLAGPSLGQSYLLNSSARTVTILSTPGQRIASTATTSTTDEARAKMLNELTTDLKISQEEKAKLVERLKREFKNVQATTISGQNGVKLLTGSGGLGAYSGAITASTGGGFAYSTGGQNSKYDIKNEDLGSRDFEGVQATGTRRITIIPADAIGNERPIEVVYEQWYSKDLGMVVYSKNSDPRFGDQTYKLTSIVRAEPDPSLFSVPTEYKKVTENGTIYRIFTSPQPLKPAAVRPARVTYFPAKPNP
jgi:hypothetical protein